MTCQSVHASKDAGFTLIEVIVVIAVISILASMAVPYASKTIDMARTDATRKRMEDDHRIIVGDPASGTAGFVGDMGRLPANLGQLNTQGAQPGPSIGLLGVQMGWRGPYATSGFSAQAYQQDGWGTTLAYGPPGAAAGQILSNGPDHALGGGDDIVYPPTAVVITGNVLVNLQVWDSTAGAYVLNPQPAAYPNESATVTFHYSSNGVESTAVVGGPGPLIVGPPFAFNGFHLGNHAVAASCTLPPRPTVNGQAVVYVPGNGQQATLTLYLR